MDRQRIDKWLWHARVVRTRTAATALVTGGCLRLNGQKIDAPSRAVRAGDVVTVALDRTVRVLKVLSFAERRGPPAAAQVLYEDLSQPQPPVAAMATVGARDPGAGRPTKRERRALERIKRDSEA